MEHTLSVYRDEPRLIAYSVPWKFYITPHLWFDLNKYIFRSNLRPRGDFSCQLLRTFSGLVAMGKLLECMWPTRFSPRRSPQIFFDHFSKFYTYKMKCWILAASRGAQTKRRTLKFNARALPWPFSESDPTSWQLAELSIPQPACTVLYCDRNVLCGAVELYCTFGINKFTVQYSYNLGAHFASQIDDTYGA